MPIPRPEPHGTRVIAHVDMDCFYVQVEQRRQPELRGLPTAVVQYNSWRGGGLIAVGYEARKFGVKRSMRGDEAKKVCPDIRLVQVPVARGKADLNLYRDAGSEVVAILATKGRCERASIDEVYLDLTDAAESMLLETPPDMLEEIEEEALKSHVLGLTNDCNEGDDDNVRRWLCRNDADHQDKLLACGAIIVAQLRGRVLKETQFTCSAGIAHNKMFAKLASAMHKPSQQTVVPTSCVKDLLASLPVKKMKQLGGKLGSSLQTDLGVNTVGDLLQFSMEKLQERYGTNTGSWLWNIARGISGEEVEGRLLPKSHGCGKTFPGPQALKSMASVEHWLTQLSEELSERIQFDLEQNKRVAHTLILHARAFKSNDMESQRKFPSKSCQLRYGTAKIQEDAKKLFDSALREFLGPQSNGWGVTSLSVSASKILDIPSGTGSIFRYFQENPSCSSNGSSRLKHDAVPLSASGSRSCMAPSNEFQQGEPASEEICKTSALSDQNKSNQTGTLVRTPKSKETCSILRYFSGSESSSTRQAVDAVKDMAVSSSGETYHGTSATESSGGVSLDEQNKDSSIGHIDETTGRTWTFNVEDIDPSVIDELPLDIQRELWGWLPLHKRAKRPNQSPNIAKYFLPARSHRDCE